MGVLDVYTVLPWRNDKESYLHDGQATRIKRAVAVVERCMSCLVF